MTTTETRLPIRQAARRSRDWRARFDAFLTERLTMPFLWGENDCAMFAAAGVAAMTGFDPLGEYRGTYFTGRDAARIGGGDCIDYVVRLLDAAGFTEIDPRRAVDGDVAAIDHGGRKSFGLFAGAQVATPAVQGLAFLPRRQAFRAWRIDYA